MIARELTHAQQSRLDSFKEADDARVVGWFHDGPLIRRGDRVSYLNPKGRLSTARKEALEALERGEG